MKTKLIALLAVAAMLLSLIAGCGNSGTPNDENPANDAPATEAPAPDAPGNSGDVGEPDDGDDSGSEPVTSEHKYNFPNNEIARLDYTNIVSMPLCEETETLTWTRTAVNLMGPLSGIGIEKYNDFEYMQYLSELANVEIEFSEMSFFSYAETLSIQLAGGDFTDIISDLVYTGDAPGAYAEEIIIDLTDKLEEYAPNYYYMINSNPEEKSNFYEDGMVLYFQTPYESFVNNQGLVIRKDWLEEQNLTAPTTYDEMFDVLVTMRDAYDCSAAIYMNKNCTIEGLTVGFDVAAFSAGGTASGSFGGGSSTMPYYVDDGVVHCTLVEDGYKSYLQELSKWYAEGLIDPDFISLEYDPFAPYMGEKIAGNDMAIWVTSGEGVDNYDVPIAALPAPTANADGMNHVSSTSLLVDSIDTYVTTNCENVKAAMGFIDYFYSEDGIMLYNYGFEGKDYTLDENGTPQFTDTIINNEFGLSPANFMRSRCAYGVFSSMMLRYRSAAYNSDINNEAWEVWSSNLDGSMHYPDNATLTVDEASLEGNYGSDIISYACQMVPRFIIGDLNFDSDWDEYIDTLTGSLDIDECIKVRQDAYDRYLTA